MKVLYYPCKRLLNGYRAVKKETSRMKCVKRMDLAGTYWVYSACWVQWIYSRRLSKELICSFLSLTLKEAGCSLS